MSISYSKQNCGFAYSRRFFECGGGEIVTRLLPLTYLSEFYSWSTIYTHGGAEEVFSFKFYHHYNRKTPLEQLVYFVIYSLRIREHFQNVL